MSNSLAIQNPPSPLEDIGTKIQEMLDKFRDKWLPRDDNVKRAMAIYASGGQQPDLEEYKKIVGGLLKENRFLEKEAFTDPLTGMPNRNAFDAALDHIIKQNNQAMKDGKKAEELAPTSVVFLDLNYLKQLNNISFSNGGDKAIKYLCDYVSKKLRKPDSHVKTPEGDLFARFGGDEFGIIMKDCKPIDAEKKIRTILQDLAKDSLNPDEKIGCHVIDDKTKAKFPAQISVAFGTAELLKELPQNEKTGNEEQDIKKIMKLSMSDAQEAEKIDKPDSKKFAASIPGGIPKADDREEAEKKVRTFFENKINAIVFGRKLVDPLTAKGGLILPKKMITNEIILPEDNIILPADKILHPSETEGVISTPKSNIMLPDNKDFGDIYTGAMQTGKPAISNQHSRLM